MVYFCVGVRGFEPPTSSSRTTRATKLRYTPFVAFQAALTFERRKDTEIELFSQCLKVIFFAWPILSVRKTDPNDTLSAIELGKTLKILPALLLCSPSLELSLTWAAGA